MNAADWKTGAATILGVLGIGAGLWWSDATAAIIISFNITSDGLKNLRAAVGDIMDRWPQSVDHTERLDIDREIRDRLLALPYIDDAHVRLREMGHVIIGEAMVVSSNEASTPAESREAARIAFEVDWRIHDLAIEWVDELRNGTPLPLAESAMEKSLPSAASDSPRAAGAVDSG